MVDMFFYRDPEEAEKQAEEQALEKSNFAAQEYAAQAEWTGEEAAGEVRLLLSFLHHYFHCHLINPCLFVLLWIYSGPKAPPAKPTPRGEPKPPRPATLPTPAQATGPTRPRLRRAGGK